MRARHEIWRGPLYLLIFGKPQVAKRTCADVAWRVTALLQRSDRRKHCGIRAVQPPLIPPITIESTGKRGSFFGILGAGCLLMADSVAKRFWPPERRTLFLNQARIEYCLFWASGGSSATFATQSVPVRTFSAFGQT
jgi:hypothetical protein